MKKKVLIIVILSILILSSIAGGAYYIYSLTEESSSKEDTKIEEKKEDTSTEEKEESPIEEKKEDTPINKQKEDEKPIGIVQMTDCKNATNLSMFCALPDIFIEKCNNVSPQNYSASLEQCLINYSTLLKKENYERAVKLLNYPSNLPTTLPTVDCKLQEDQNAFCQKPDEFIDSCLLQTKVSPKDTYYANKMKECATTTNMGLTKEKLEERRNRYNKAKEKLNKLFPTTKIVNFSSVDCTKEEALFCTLPDDYVEGCYDATLPRNPTQQQITSQNNMYASKINNCIRTNNNINLDKKKYSRAKQLLLEKDPTLKVNEVASVDCKLENQLSYFCMKPDTYISECKTINNTPKENHISLLLQCIQKEKNRMSQDTYSNALKLLNNPSELPLELPEIDCKLETKDDLFCDFPDKFIKGCKLANNKTDEDYMNKLYYCLKFDRSKLTSDEYLNAIKLLNEDKVKNFKLLPSSLPTVDCFNTDKDDMICREPDQFVKDCKDQSDYKDYPSKLNWCLVNKKQLMNKDKYNKAVKELNYPKIIPREFPSIDCSDESNQLSFCRRPDEFISQCKEINRNNEGDYTNKLINCVRNNTNIIQPQNYEKAIKLLNNPKGLPSTAPTEDCTQQDDQNLFCITPDKYINSCKDATNTTDKRYTEKLLMCLIENKDKMTQSTYTEALKLIGNPTTLPTVLPSVDCNENEGRNFCRSPDKFIKECASVRHPSDEDYKSMLKNCLITDFSFLNNDSYKEALKLLNNPPGFPTDLSVNCKNQTNLTSFCSDPYKYVSNCEGVEKSLSYVSLLYQCSNNSVYLKQLQSNPESYKKAIQHLQTNVLPSAVPTVNCDDKQKLNTFCSKPDEYIRDCKSFVSPTPEEMINQCILKERELLMSNKDGYDRALKQLNSLGISNLPTSIPTVSCDAKNNPSMFCSKPDEYIEFCKPFIAPTPEEMIKSCYSDMAKRGNLTALQNNSTGYYRALQLLNNPKTLPSTVPTQICDSRLLDQDPYGFISSCLFNENADKLAKELNDLNSRYQQPISKTPEQKKSYDKAYSYILDKKPTIDLYSYPTNCNEANNLGGPLMSANICELLPSLYDSCAYADKEKIKYQLQNCFNKGGYKEELIAFADKINKKENKSIFDIQSLRNKQGCTEEYINSNGYKDKRVNLDYYFKNKEGCKEYSSKVQDECKFNKDDTAVIKCFENGFVDAVKGRCEIYQKETGKMATEFGGAFQYKETVTAFRNDKFVNENPDLCRKAGIEPCDNENYAKNNIDKCIGKIKDHPCLDMNGGYMYLKSHAEECRKLKLGEPCNFNDYLVNHGEECRKLNFEPCKVDGYTINHGEECRKLNFEPCKINEYLFNNEEECRKLNFEPCKVNEYIFNNSDKCRKLNFEPCDKKEYRDLQMQKIRDQYYLPDGTAKYTIDKTCDLINECDKGFGVGNIEWDKCEKFNNKKYNQCNDKEYLENNKEKCKLISPNFNPCKDQIYMWQNSESCRKDGFEACKDDSYLNSIFMKDSNKCRKVNIEPCENQNYLDGHREECRKINKKYEPCENENYLFNNEDECRKNGYEACDKEEYIKYSWNKDKCRSLGKLKNEPCDKEEYIKSDYNNALECKSISSKYNPCLNETYKQINSSECEPCTRKGYLTKNSIECRKKGFEACTDKEFMLSNSKECRNINNGFYEACNDGDFNSKNIDECRKISINWEPCEREDYLVKNGKECRGINSKYEACKNQNYLFNNGEECRKLNFEPCEISSYNAVNLRECKNINDKYDLCKLEQYKGNWECQQNKCEDISYLENNTESCRKQGFEPCKNYSYLTKNSNECRNLNFEACKEQQYFYDNIDECKSKMKATEEICEDITFKNVLQDKCDLLNFKKYNKCLGNESGFDMNYTKNNKDKCRKVNIEPCENYFYKEENQDECDAINFEKYNNCSRGLYTNYMLKNGKKCRELSDQGKLTYYEGKFEPCIIDSNYAEQNAEECKDYLQFNSLNEGEGRESVDRPLDRIHTRSKLKFSNYNQYIRTLNINI